MIAFVPVFFFASVYAQVSLGYNANSAGLYLLGLEHAELWGLTIAVLHTIPYLGAAVVAGAVILDPGYRIRGLRDSKLLPAERREVLAERIREHAIAWAVAAVDAARIDQINIYHASRAAMLEAVMRLAPVPDHLLIDAVKIDCDLPQKPIIHGDALSASIAAASILAKVERDRMMCEWDAVFPQYGLASHKGYSTPKHLAALRELGPTPLHRQSFAPVWQNPVPQEAFAFMNEDEMEVLAAEDLAV